MTYIDDASIVLRADPAYALNDVAYIGEYDQCIDDDPEPITLIGGAVGSQGPISSPARPRNIPFGFGPHGDGGPGGSEWGIGPLVP